MRELKILANDKLPPGDRDWIIIEASNSTLFRVRFNCFQPKDDKAFWYSAWFSTSAEAQQLAERWADQYGVEVIHCKKSGLAA
jgi:hypothetical protein